MASNHYNIPNWAGKPPPGLHLDVVKDGKLFQKLMIDEKKSYLFGRNPTLNDFCIDHQSCSRVHSALVYHKNLERVFLVDLGSTHGTYIGSLRLESNKPTQLPINSTFHFGASTRYYILRERPTLASKQNENSENAESGPLTLPDSEIELDNLTEFNTAHNKRVSMIGIKEEEDKVVTKPRTVLVRFKEEEDVINPEDIDPSVGKFRNLIQTTIVPRKKIKLDSGFSVSSNTEKSFNILKPQIDSSFHSFSNPILSTSLSIKLGINLPNPAPDVNIDEPLTEIGSSHNDTNEEESGSCPKKKKYAKEAWPGRRPALL